MYEDLKQKLAELVAKYQAASADGKVTLGEVWEMVNLVLADLVPYVEKFNLAGDDKKKLVLDTLSKFYDEVIAPLDIPYVPNFLEPLVDTGLKSLLLELADGAVDALVKILKDTATTVPVKPAGQSHA